MQRKNTIVDILKMIPCLETRELQAGDAEYVNK
jgi:hypothetical protein